MYHQDLPRQVDVHIKGSNTYCFHQISWLIFCFSRFGVIQFLLAMGRLCPVRCAGHQRERERERETSQIF